MESGRENLDTKRQVLCPLEHVFIGSNPNVDGRHFSSGDILDSLTQKFLREKLLKPGTSIDVRRAFPDPVFPSGLVILDADSVIDAYNLDMEPYFKLADVDEKTGLIIPLWEIGLINKDRQVANDMVGILRLNSNFEKYFSLEKPQDRDCLILKLKT